MILPRPDPQRLGLIGYGAFGRLAAQALAPHFQIVAHDPVVEGLASLAEAAACPIVVLAVPVHAVAETVAAIAPDVQPGAMVLDVGSVKVEPTQAMDSGLPAGVEVVGLHPLFGPQSAKNGIAGLRLAVCPVRGDHAARRVAAWCRSRLGLKVFLVSAEDHDREAAVTQGLTHLIARLLLAMQPMPTRLTTASFDRIMEAVEMVRHDSPAVYHAIERANPFAAEVRDRFFALAEQARAEIEKG